MTKLMTVVPVPTQGLITQEGIDYMAKFLPPDTQVDTCTIAYGSASIECEYEDMLNAPGTVAACIQAAKDGYDGIFIDCFGDPGLRAARECVDIPVFGGFEPATHIAMGLGDRIGIITVLKNVIPLKWGLIAKAHLSKRIVSIRSIDMPVLDLAQHDKLVGAMLEESINAIEKDGVEVLIAGCTGMIGVTEAIEAGLKKAGYDVPVIESCQSALMLLDLYVRMGLKQSRITYMKPPKGIG